jgi:hypothetical protein
LGDSFKLFTAASYTGSFTNLILPALPAGLTWNSSALASGGIISVTNSVVLPPPLITHVNLSASGVSFMLSGAGQSGQDYVLWASSNLTASAWAPVLTNLADTNGVFNFADLQASNFAQRFYRVQAQ